MAVLDPTGSQNPAQWVMREVQELQLHLLLPPTAVIAPRFCGRSSYTMLRKRTKTRRWTFFSFPILLSHGKINLYCFRARLSVLGPFHKRQSLHCLWEPWNRQPTYPLRNVLFLFFNTVRKMFFIVIESPALNSDRSRLTLWFCHLQIM